MKPRNLKGHHSGTARHPIGPLALETLLLPFPRPAAWAKQTVALRAGFNADAQHQNLRVELVCSRVMVCS